MTTTARPDAPPALPAHGELRLPTVAIASYSVDLPGEGGEDEQLGDRASQTAFRELLDDWRQRWRGWHGEDPLGDAPTEELQKHQLDRAHARAGDDAARLVDRAVDDYAGELAAVIRHFRRLSGWRGVQRVIAGGGFQRSDIGHQALRRAAVQLADDAAPVELRSLHHEPDEGGLIGWVHIVPRRLLEAYDAFLAVDIGGTNLRCGLVAANLPQAADLSQATVLRRAKWRHAKDEPDREALLDGLAAHLRELAGHAAADGLRLAPLVGLACPGVMRADGVILRGAQNLPGTWEGESFHLPQAVTGRLPSIDGAPVHCLLHNDAVVQGLSETPHTRDVERWAVLTIGTGLGNASFVNLPAGQTHSVQD